MKRSRVVWSLAWTTLVSAVLLTRSANGQEQGATDVSPRRPPQMTRDMMSCLQQRNVPNASEMFAQVFRVIADHVLDFFFNSLWGLSGRL
uniref:Putative secreted protein n=1 Tax=Ixodes ricinus TaxID=34613 RepID=A0A147BGG4_IXORI